ncbi:3-oxo-tetronate kinase [Oceanibacterium hippocampi]|uniref:3-oxo-tetronate kinase n=1 Tax=Oceanibacterium hippocampi TaxID=745714 RepID=A0A1Y5TJ55_9PROT|nr:3-oxo-tetronate kinase [Oceanibacterium hippocampi]SLN65190.1 hypothetical protein OCH7691_02970 [Oceanibacterium hippocampi]
MLLGCIADDLTGATDLALMLAREGMRTVQVNGLPEACAPAPEADAIVVALKSRTVEAAEAVSWSLAALDWLRAAGARRFFFKYCSTFDSSDRGNIGPVAEALLESLGAPLAIACPAFPANGRSVYRGHLFIGDRLLSDSPMRDHPLTPMLDSNLVAVLQRQSRGPVGLVSCETVEAGAEAVADALRAAADAGRRLMIVDAISDGHLRVIGAAVADSLLVTGGSGVALGLPAAWRARGLLQGPAREAAIEAPAGPAIVVAGSCSAATRAQVEAARAVMPHLQIDARRLHEDPAEIDRACAWVRDHLGSRPLLVYSSATPDLVELLQRKLGRERAGSLVESALARLAETAVGAGARRIVVAGGETSGAVMAALGVRQLTIGQEIDPGVPWTRSVDGPDLALALKSGNFGSEDFFAKALGMLA